MRCPFCAASIIWQHGWPACDCDADRKLMLTVAQVARFLCVSRGGVYHMISDGYLHADKSQRPIRVAMITLKAYLAGEHAEFAYRQHRKQAAHP